LVESRRWWPLRLESIGLCSRRRRRARCCSDLRMLASPRRGSRSSFSIQWRRSSCMAENSTRRSSARERSRGEGRTASHRSPWIEPFRRLRALEVPFGIFRMWSSSPAAERLRPIDVAVSSLMDGEAYFWQADSAASESTYAFPILRVRSPFKTDVRADAHAIARSRRDRLAFTLRESEQARQTGESGRKRSWR
jgi:hypothetical protein